MLPLQCLMGLVGLLLWAPLLQAQTWNYQDILTNERQGGQYPDLTQDTAGGLHLSFWNQFTDRLWYGYLAPGATQWQLESVDPGVAGGYRSTIFVDSLDTVHVAWFANRAGKLQLKYAKKSIGNLGWQVRQVRDSTWGNYGPIWTFSSGSVQASLDLYVRPDYGVSIVFFDATFEGCDEEEDEVGLEMHLVRGDGESTWLVNTFGNFPALPLDYGFEACEVEAAGARYGEYCRFVRRPGTDLLTVITADKINGDLLRFDETIPLEPPSFWERYVLDTNRRVTRAYLGNVPDQWYAKASFEGMDAAFSPDGRLQVSYAMSDRYGWNEDPVIDNVNRNVVNLFFQTITNPNTTDRLTTFDPGLNASVATYQYRTSTSLEVANDSSFYFTAANLRNNNYQLYETTDTGSTWLRSTVAPAGMKRMEAPLQLVGDTLLHTVYYDDNSRRLFHATRPRSTTAGPWQVQPITRSANAGASFASYLHRGTSPPELHLVYTDDWNELLVYGEQNNGQWEWDTVTAGATMSNPAITRTNDGLLHIMVREEEPDRIRYYRQQSGGGWSSEFLENNTLVGELQLATGTDGQSLFATYYDIATAGLRILENDGSGWAPAQTIANHPDNFEGRLHRLQVGANNRPFVAYLEESFDPAATDSLIIWLAGRNALGNWQREMVDYDSSVTNISGLDFALQANDTAHIAYQRVDPFSDTVMVYLLQTPQGWARAAMPSFYSLGEGAPLQLQLDSLNKPWFAQNIYGQPAEVQLFSFGTEAPGFAPFYVNNNLPNGQIANQFDFWLEGAEMWILGQKQAENNSGLGMLYLGNWPAEVDLISRPEELAAAREPVQVYPNPAGEHLWIESTSELHTMRLRNLQGELVQQQPLRPGAERHHLLLRHLPAGVYLLELQGKGYSSTHKLLRLGR